MRPVECNVEAEVLAAVLESRWPEQVEPRLLEHVAACPVCADVAAVAGALSAGRDDARTAEVPDSGRVWWLAQVRARREAAKSAGRPITAAQVIAFACATGLFGACFGAMSTWFQALVGHVVTSFAGIEMQSLLLSAGAFVAGHSVLFLVMGTVLLLAPAAVYLVVVRD